MNMRNESLIDILDKKSLENLKSIHKDENFSMIRRSSLYYNCISYSLDIESYFIWPKYSGVIKENRSDIIEITWFWPNVLPVNDTLDTFKKFYNMFGFEETNNPEYEYGYKKIALYSIDGKITHAVNIHPGGLCSGKLGGGPVITHTFGFDEQNGLSNIYGNINYFVIKDLPHQREETLKIIRHYS